MADLHEVNMALAVNAAKDSKTKGGVAIGAVLVDEATGQLIAIGESSVHISKDPTAHAEINAIRQASQKLGTDDLYNLTLYSTLEPCHMCLSAAAWARIHRVFFGAYRKDVDQALFEITGDFSDEDEGGRMNLREKTHMVVKGGILEPDCSLLLAGYRDLPRHSK